ncbi:mediator of RNA polymerase II transcription subunit 7 [Scheffersomyces xylosifermentans]|uniref:mediator of RNA polymerase II transcription subunit 7 n=1 Tax=Scheffersomyces xylosifermentans TaxID=1304137 RepID=UPI00315CB861
MSTANGDLISSLYPPPPVYVKFFTEENQNKLQAWQKTQKKTQKELSKSESEDQPEKSNSVPPGELRFLVPPKPPAGTHYRGYGNLWSFEDKLPSLKSANWEQLYQDDDESITSETKIKELHKLMDSLLLNFLELIGLASIDPSQYESKIKDISLILININHLLNTYRPHQSRESLIMLLKKQIDAKRASINQIDKVSQEVRAKLLKLTNLDDVPMSGQDSSLDELLKSTNKDGDIEKEREELIKKLLDE